MKDFIPQMEPWFDVEEQNALNAYMSQGGWVTEFKQTEQFESLIAEYTGSKHCIAVNNGTISLTLAAIACGIKFGDEVIVPNYTMIATPNSVKMIGAKPVFIDVEKETLCMDFKKLEKALTKKTKAIILVSSNGRYPCVDIDNFKVFCKDNNLKMIEDSAQSLGSFYPSGKHMGTVGSIGSFSFSAPKVISTGQGGALVTNDDSLAYKLRRLKDFGRSGGGNDIHSTIGFNFKFTDIQAVIGIEQMKKLQWRVDRKKDIFNKYKSLLEGTESINLFSQDLDKTTPWFIDSIVEDRINLMKYLKDCGVGTRVMYPPINKQEAYNTNENFPVSNMIGEKGLWLPSASQLTDEEIEFVCHKIISFYNN
jgi:perosamine synthetase